MAGKSSITRMSRPARERIERHLREDRLTLNEIIDDLREHFPDETIPSRSAIWRQKANFDRMERRFSEQKAMAAAMLDLVREDSGESVAALLVHVITSLVAHAALAAHGDDDSDAKDGGADIDTVLKLARAGAAVIGAYRDRVSLREEIRKEMLTQQKDRLDALSKQGAISPEALAHVVRVVYDI